MAVRPMRKPRERSHEDLTIHERLDEHESRIEALEGVAVSIDKVADRIKRYGLLILGALAASGVVTGPWGKFLAEIVARSAGQ
jgi:hypothetical protein